MTRADFAQKLLDAADDIDGLSRRDLQILLRRAALRIRNELQETGAVILDAELLSVFDAIVNANDEEFTRDQAVSSVLRDWAISCPSLVDLHEDS